MDEQELRSERDALGEVRVPVTALYGAQTQRAIDNFPISGLRLPGPMIRALGLIKGAVSEANRRLGLLDAERATAIGQAAEQVEAGRYDAHFPIDIFQSGSGTSSNMNANEVIANLATELLGRKVHPNDDVNMSQSSNDVIPTAIHVSAALTAHEWTLPGLRHLSATIARKGTALDHVVKTGRTHLMDAMPIRFSQELSGWRAQVDADIARLTDSLDRVYELAIGGTAVGTGVNAPPELGNLVATILAERTGLPFVSARNRFQHMAAQDVAVELSGQLKVVAVTLTKVANDLRWMNSGPVAGLAEIELEAIQPGSSIMPGKINPVIPEAVCMVAAQIIGNDLTITLGGQAGNFQLNTMLPMIAYNLVQSLHIAGTAARLLADSAIAGFAVNEEGIRRRLGENPILVTALNREIGYDLGAKIVRAAYSQKRSLKEVAREMTDLSSERLDELLDPRRLTEGGI
ncbi:MAG: class II fumarate hydratase [Candidatus Schekmanbacteria bacterium]|nr:class II fumarate hydratase [Candidatus Schekmanbacteria bacterium]